MVEKDDITKITDDDLKKGMLQARRRLKQASRPQLPAMAKLENMFMDISSLEVQLQEHIDEIQRRRDNRADEREELHLVLAEAADTRQKWTLGVVVIAAIAAVASAYSTYQMANSEVIEAANKIEIDELKKEIERRKQGWLDEAIDEFEEVKVFAEPEIGSEKNQAESSDDTSE